MKKGAFALAGALVWSSAAGVLVTAAAWAQAPAAQPAPQTAQPAGTRVQAAPAASVGEGVRGEAEHTQEALEIARLVQAEKYAEALVIADRALRAREAGVGPNHLEVADALDVVAGLHCATGAFDRAEPFYRRALRIREAGQGATSAGAAHAHARLARLYQAKGDLSQADTEAGRALRAEESALGPEHPEVAEALDRVGEIAVAAGHGDRAAALWRRALSIAERTLRRGHLGWSAAQLAAWEQAQHALDGRIDSLLAERIGDADVARLALEAAFLHKGRTLDELAEAASAGRSAGDPEAAGKLEA
jgi:tetratricopeptide (TPR) repeat protein